MAKEEKFNITAADSDESALFYSEPNEEVKKACVGYVRMDFGSGKEFWHTWHGLHEGLNTQNFKSDLQTVVDGLRENLLKDRSSMQRFIDENHSLKLENGRGFKAQTDDCTFYLRCYPHSGYYDCYCYCYDRELLEQAMDKKLYEEEIEELTPEMEMM